jgi:hypothetical protein
MRLAGLKLHEHKSTLIAESINFCGRIVSKNGVQFAPRTLDGLQELPPPATGSELHQYLGATSWMRASISAFAERVDPLQTLLASIISKVGATKRATAKVKLGSLWGAEHQAVFIDM